jgi:diguanylate cyclase (GGDEF)-like protein
LDLVSADTNTGDLPPGSALKEAEINVSAEAVTAAQRATPLPGGALEGYGSILNSPPPGPTFDDLVRLACHAVRTPIALISFPAEDGERVGASVGWPATARRIAGADSLMARVLGEGTCDLFVVPDAREDARFADCPFVTGAPGLRFYAAVPLLSPEGQALGTLAVADTAPRLLDNPQVSALTALARQVVLMLELHRQVEELHAIATTRGHAEESARWQARHDNLTGLPNRVFFLEQVEEALRVHKERAEVPTGLPDGRRKQKPAPARSDGAAVLFVDLDRFKRINDTLGHAAGDILLREVAARFAGCLRPEDMLARYAGDEFTVLLPNAPGGLTYVANVAQMLLRTLRRPVVLGTGEYHVSASVGMALAPRDGEDAHTLIKNADIAMYQAKTRGGYEAYSRKMNADGYQRLIAEGELRRALERGELTVAYQPQVDLLTGGIVGTEALCRWHHPERGMVPPAHFIQVAEQADLIIPLGEFVLRQACADAARWRAEGRPDLRVAVNLSARQLTQTNLVETVMDALASNGLPGDALDLELTETALCANGDSTPQTIQRLRALGIRLVVDDFGTGYSSLAYLRQFPVDVLKVDRTFVAGLGNSTRDDALVRALIEMAHALGLKVVAEGVETEIQLGCLRSLDCDYVQGYLFSRPVSIDGLRALLLSNRGTGHHRRVLGVLTGPPITGENGGETLGLAGLGGKRGRGGIQRISP